MAVSLFTRWGGQHAYSGFTFRTRYDVYADMSDSSSTPYIRLQNCRIRSNDDISTLLGPKLPLTVKIRINGTGTTYTFTTSSSQQHHDIEWSDLESYYYVDLSSPTNITIPGNASEFTINATITDKNGATYTYVEHACGPKSNSLSGTTSINTGAVATFTLKNSIQNSEYYGATSHMTYKFPSVATYKTVEAYTTPYTPLEYSRDSVTSISYVPVIGDAQAGEKANSSDIANNYISFAYYYYTHDDYFGDRPTGAPSPGEIAPGSYNGANTDNAILISVVHLKVAVTARTNVDSSLLPEIASTQRIGTYDARLAAYGAGVQGVTTYGMYITCVTRDESYEDTRKPYPPYTNRQFKLKYGSTLTSVVIRDASSGSTSTKTYNPTTTTTHRYGTISLDSIVNNAEIRATLYTTYGQSITYSDYVSVIGYSPPSLPTYSARRCSAVSSGSGSDYYTYNGTIYHIDDYGEYCLIEWAVDITPLNSNNNKSLRIKEPSTTSSSGYYTRTISLSGYSESGFYVVAANGEKSYDIVFTAQDSFQTTTRTIALSTVLAIMDILKRGCGLSFGKVAELDRTLDIHRTWLLRMPNTINIGNYNSGNAINLASWMHQTEARIQNIINRRPIGIYYKGQFYDNLTMQAIPTSAGTLTQNTSMQYFKFQINQYIASAMLVSSAVNVQRNYLHIKIERLVSFASPYYPGDVVFRPTLYLMSSKPTSVNQSTGVPNGTVLTSMQLQGALEYSSSGLDPADHYQYWHIYQPSHSMNVKLNVSSYRGQNIWIVISLASGVSASGATSMLGYADISEIAFLYS